MFLRLEWHIFNYRKQEKYFSRGLALKDLQIKLTPQYGKIVFVFAIFKVSVSPLNTCYITTHEITSNTAKGLHQTTRDVGINDTRL